MTNELYFNDQRVIVAAEKWRDHLKWCDRMAETTRLSLVDRRISLQILINEACHREMKQLHSTEAKVEVRKQWVHIASLVAQDMSHQDDSAVVLKNLSCMGVFQTKTHLAYGDNSEARTNRVELMALKMAEMRKSGVLFLNP